MTPHEQVADLRPGDVVELRDDRWPDVVTRGPVHQSGDYLWVGDVVVRDKDPRRQFAPHTAHLTVISRAPRPLYVNHDRTEPVPGDVVRDADDADASVWLHQRPSDEPDDPYPWVGNYDGADHWYSRDQLPRRLRLLVDGEIGQVVP